MEALNISVMLEWWTQALNKTDVLKYCKDQGINSEQWELLYFKVHTAVTTVLGLQWNRYKSNKMDN